MLRANRRVLAVLGVLGVLAARHPMKSHAGGPPTANGKLIGTYEKSPGRGLPIGNLTSQYFANLYLDGMDRLASPYVRYMDDFVFWGK